MIIGELIVKQYVIKEDEYWTGFLNFYRDFNHGAFDDNDFEVMMEELADMQGEHGRLQKLEDVLNILIGMLYDAMDGTNDSVNHAVEFIKVDDKFILSYAYNNY
jgi:hypothetical protein